MVCFSHSWLALKHVSSYLVSKLNYKISICCLAVWWSGTSFLQGNWINLCNLNEHQSCIFFFFPPWWFWESRWTQSPSAVAVLTRNVSVGRLPCVCLEFHSSLTESLLSRSKMKGCCEAGPGRDFSSYCCWPFRAMWPLVLGDYAASVVAVFLVYFPIVVIKYSDAGNLREKGIVLAYSFQHNPQVHQVLWHGGKLRQQSWNSWSHHTRHHHQKRAVDAHTLASSPSPFKSFGALTKLRWIFPHQLAWWTTFSTGMLSPRSSWVLSLWQQLLTIVGWWQSSGTITGGLAKPLASAIRGQTDLISA